jgi:hypothetical protein
VLNAVDGRVLAEWPIQHAAPIVSQDGFRVPASAAWWSASGTTMVTSSAVNTAVWKTGTEEAESFAKVMRRVPWRIRNGRLDLLRTGRLRGQILRDDQPLVDAEVSIEIRTAPDIGSAKITWELMRMTYTTRTARSTTDGRFVLPRLVPGVYTMRVKTGPLDRTFEAFVSADAEDDSEQTFDVAR